MATSKEVASPLTDLPDHLLAEIFLRLHDPADLARASAACVSFRRLATDRSFLCRFRRLHAPPLLGFVVAGRFRPALPPLPSAPAARALALAADFHYYFILSRCRWTVQDVRDGRVLLEDIDGDLDERPPVFKDLAVCDPLHRRYVVLPPVPHHLADSLENPFPMVPGARCKPFLIPLSEEEAATGETAFRVILVAHCKTSLAAFVFSSSTGQWQAAASKAWSDLGDKRDMAKMSWVHPYILRRHFAYGCFYWDWVEFGSNKLLLLDTSKMEFSIADLPPGKWSMVGIAIVEAGDGRLGMFGFHDETSSDLSYAIAMNKGESPSQWQMEKTISLDSGYRYYITDATQRYLLLRRIQASSLENPLVDYFSMDFKTLQLQWVYDKLDCILDETYTYINFPPSLLSSRRI